MVEVQDYSSMFEKNPIAQVIIDPEYNFVLINESFCKMIGFPKDKLMAMKFSDLRAREMIKYIKDSGESVDDAIRGKRITTGETTFETATGTYIVVRTNIPLVDEKKSLRYVYLTYNDVTKIVQAQEYCEIKVTEAADSCGMITKNIEDVSVNAEKASLGMGQIAKAMQDMSAAVEEITASMESVSTLSKETNDLSKKGAELAHKAENSMSQISVSSEKVYGIVSDVEKQMGEISKIVVLIRDLASQTNLLALNAAIEAARAGDAGRGFAVVATEVKSLAQESRNSAERIEEMITTLKKSTQNASIAMGDAKGTVAQGEKMVAEMLQSFNKIVTAVDKMATSASEVAAATQEQAATTEEVTASITEVASLIEKTAKDAGDVVTANEESCNALEGIAQTVRNLKKSDGQKTEIMKAAKA